MKFIKSYHFIVYWFCFFSLILSFMPFLQYIGGVFGLIGVGLSLFGIKWARENRLQDRPQIRAFRRALIAVFMGMIVTSIVRFNSSFQFVSDLEDEMNAVRKTLGLELSINAKKAEEIYKEYNMELPK